MLQTKQIILNIKLEYKLHVVFYLWRQEVGLTGGFSVITSTCGVHLFKSASRVALGMYVQVCI